MPASGGHARSAAPRSRSGKASARAAPPLRDGSQRSPSAGCAALAPCPPRARSMARMTSPSPRAAGGAHDRTRSNRCKIWIRVHESSCPAKPGGRAARYGSLPPVGWRHSPQTPYRSRSISSTSSLPSLSAPERAARSSLIALPLLRFRTSPRVEPFIFLMPPRPSPSVCER